MLICIYMPFFHSYCLSHWNLHTAHFKTISRVKSSKDFPITHNLMHSFVKIPNSVWFGIIFAFRLVCSKPCLLCKECLHLLCQSVLHTVKTSLMNLPSKKTEKNILVSWRESTTWKVGSTTMNRCYRSVTK